MAANGVKGTYFDKSSLLEKVEEEQVEERLVMPGCEVRVVCRDPSQKPPRFANGCKCIA